MDPVTALPPPPPPPPSRRRPLSFWLALLLGLGLAASAFLNLILFVAVAGDVDAGGVADFEEVLVDGKRSQDQKIVVIPIHGIIMEEGDGPGSRHLVTDIRKILRNLREDEDVKAVVLDIDSPGGGVTASDQIYHELHRFRKETGIPIVALFGDVAASGGYYVAMASDHVMAHTTSITGSIGVISQFPMVKELMEKIGVEITTIKSLNEEGRPSFKDIGSPFREMTPPERVLFQNLVTEMWQRFTSVVAEGRKGKLTLEQVRDLADGRVFTGEQALKLKLVDSLGYQEDAFARARELGDAADAKVIRLKHRSTFLELLSMSAAASSKPDLLRFLESSGRSGPRVMYLWSGS